MIEAKVLVIGSGAGGAPAAAALAEAWGDEVAILEAGRWNTGADFTQVEREMVPRLYVGGGAQATEDGALGILQGEGVGGSTVINDGVCFSPPPEMVPRWTACGADLRVGELDPFVAEVLAALSVQQIPKSKINRANYLLGLGAARLGWAGERLHHNSPSCVECGFRHVGCTYNLKQSMNLTYVPRAVASGARLYPEVRAQGLRRAGGRWEIVTDREVFRADHVVLAAGVVQTPTLLLRSGIPAGEGLQFHVETLLWGDFDDPVDGFAGIPMSYAVMEFADVFGHTGPGYVIESVGVQPLAFSVQPQAQGAVHEEVLRRYRYLAGAVCLARSRGRGKITLGAGDRPAITYPLVEEDALMIRHFWERGVELYRAAGARRVLLPHRDLCWTTEAPPASLRIEAGRLYLYTAHPFGGANRGTVTDAAGRVRGQPGLWVLDASAFPEALGVNPQVTIAALALQGARRLLSEA